MTTNNIKFTNEELGMIASVFGATNPDNLPEGGTIFAKAIGFISYGNYKPAKKIDFSYMEEDDPLFGWLTSD